MHSEGDNMFLLSPVSSAGTRVGCGSVPTDSKMSGLPSSLHCTLSATTTKVWAFLTLIFLSVFQCFVALLGLLFFLSLLHAYHENLPSCQPLLSLQLRSDFLFLRSAIYSLVMLWLHEHMYRLWPDMWFSPFIITFYYLILSYKKLSRIYFLNCV